MRDHDFRSDREILLSIERKLVTLMGEYEMDFYDRIIAGIAALQAGDTAALSQHVAAIDSHLSAIDTQELQLQGDDTASKGRLDAIEAGLGKIADAVGPVQTPAPSGTGTTSPAPADGSQSADVTPGSDTAPGASAPIPASGPGSETTGQVDTPTTTG